MLCSQSMRRHIVHTRCQVYYQRRSASMQRRRRSRKLRSYDDNSCVRKQREGLVRVQSCG